MVKPLYSKHVYHALPVLPCIYLSNIFRPGCLYQVYHYSAVQWLPLMHPLSKITTFTMHTVNINSEALLIKETVNIWFVKVQLLKKNTYFLKIAIVYAMSQHGFSGICLQWNSGGMESTSPPSPKETPDPQYTCLSKSRLRRNFLQLISAKQQHLTLNTSLI